MRATTTTAPTAADFEQAFCYNAGSRQIIDVSEIREWTGWSAATIRKLATEHPSFEYHKAEYHKSGRGAASWRSRMNMPAASYEPAQVWLNDDALAAKLAEAERRAAIRLARRAAARRNR